VVSFSQARIGLESIAARFPRAPVTFSEPKAPSASPFGSLSSRRRHGIDECDHPGARQPDPMLRGVAGQQISLKKGQLPFSPTSPLPGASTVYQDASVSA
jgi:hypothetical protein